MSPVSSCFEFWEAIKPLKCERSKLPGPGLHSAVGNEGQVEENSTANPNSHGHGVGDTGGRVALWLESRSEGEKSRRMELVSSTPEAETGGFGDLRSARGI